MEGKIVIQAMDKIIAVFDDIGAPETVSRCTRLLNHNCNESLHARVYGIIPKEKSFAIELINFAAQLAAMIHNGSYEGAIGMIYKHFGVYHEEERNQLAYKDRERIRMASEKHQEIKKKNRHSLKPPLKIGPTKGESLGLDEINYCAGFGFEDHPVEGVAEFEALQNQIESGEKQIETAENNENADDFSDEN